MNSKPVVQSSDCYYTIPPPAIGITLLLLWLLWALPDITAVPDPSVQTRPIDLLSVMVRP